MSNENRNNIHWKERLENAGNLPGEVLQDKAAAWQKLQSRLQQQPHSKSIAGYWIAAACVLLAILFPFIFMHNNNSGILKNTALTNTIKDSATAEVLPVKKDSITVIIQTSATKKETVKTKTINTTVLIPVAPSIINTQIKDSEIIQPPLPADSTVTIFATAQSKKKLKVVHVNELGDPVEIAQDITRNNEQHSFNLKLANEEVFNNASVAGKPRFAIINFKTTPTN